MTATRISESDLKRIPRSGSVIAYAPHAGESDVAAILSTLRGVRPDISLTAAGGPLGATVLPVYAHEGTTGFEIRIGTAIDPARLDSMPDDQAREAYLRWRVELLANRAAFKPETNKSMRRAAAPDLPFEEIVPPVNPAALAAEVAALPADSLLDRAGDLCVYLAPAMPALLREIGRLREVTFRAAGEGTGHALDVDRFDRHYLHLFVWNTAKSEIVGAYRLGHTDDGPESLYTHTLFRFDQEFLDTMGPAIELGRSFVRAEYQRGFAPLLLLWKGIGKFVARNPRYRVLFGPVSISNRYQTLSRDLMISFLERQASLEEWKRLVRPRRAPERAQTAVCCADLEELADVVSDIEAGEAGVPVLLRQYLKLGGRLMSFNVDSEFCDALDGLIAVDLRKTEPKLLERYLGKGESATFLDYHKRTEWNTPKLSRS